MKKQLIYISIILLFSLPSLLFAGDAGQETPFTIGAGARALGMGGAFISIAEDASTIYYNPAGLPNLNYQELSLMHINLLEGTVYNYAGWVYPDSKLGGFGIGYFRIGTDDIIRSSDFASNGTFGYSNSQLLFSYGKNLHGGIALGLSFKIVNQVLDSLSDYGVGFDVGMTIKISEHITGGLIFRDILPPELELVNHSETTPITLAGGIGLKKIKLSDSYSINGAFELEKIENRSVKIHSGLELLVSDKYALRSGYDRDNITFGLGLTMKRLKIDYAYKVIDYISDSHRFTLSFLIGTSIKDKLKQEEQLQEERGSELLADERLQRFEFYKEKANEYHHRFMLDSALAYYQRALAFDEHNNEIIGIIAGIENSIKISQETESRNRQYMFEINSTRVTFLTQAQNFFDKKYYHAALDMLQLILDSNPNDADAVVFRDRIDSVMTDVLQREISNAEKAEAVGDNLGAIEAYDRILEIDPNNSTALDGLRSIASRINIAQQLNSGIQSYNNNNLRKAKKTFSAVLSIDKNNPVAIEYLKKIDLSEVKQTTLEDLQKNKDIWQLYLDGLRYMRNKEYQNAIDAWDKVLEEYPNNVNTLNNIEQARLRLKSEKTDE